MRAARHTARGETLPDGRGGLRILQKENFKTATDKWALVQKCREQTFRDKE